MKAIVTRRLPDSEGNLVTYLPIGTTCDLVGIGRTTVSNWIQTGCVRSLDGKLGLNRYVSVLDVAKLKAMPRTRVLELGIIKTPLAVRRNGALKREEYQRKTSPAEHHREEWDSYDIGYVVTALERGETHEAIAKELGRTYAAINDQVERLRRAGDLPRRSEDDGAWRRRLPIVLHADELKEFSEVTS